MKAASKEQTDSNLIGESFKCSGGNPTIFPYQLGYARFCVLQLKTLAIITNFIFNFTAVSYNKVER